jgi:hypothetical protein
MANYFDQFDAPQSGPVRLYSPNPDAPTVYGAPNTNGPVAPTQGNYFDKFDASAGAPVSIPRVVGQFAQGNNDAFANTLGYPVDLINSGARLAGMRTSDTPALGSQSFKNIFDYVATLPGRVRDAIGGESFAPFTESRTARFDPQNRAERIAQDIGGAVGSTAANMMPGMAVLRSAAPVAEAVQGARIAQPSLAESVARATTAKPVAQAAFSAAGNVAGSESNNPYVGAATSMALPVLVHGAQRTFSAAPAASTQEAERRALLQFGQDNSLGPLTAGKILNSKGLQVLESASSKLPLPFIGGRVAKTEEAGRNAFQAAALGKAGTTGETAVTPSVLADAKARIGRTFDNLENNTTVNIDPQFGTDLANARADFSKQLESQMPASVTSKLDDLQKASTALNQPGTTGVTLDGQTYKNIRSKLSAQLSRASGTDKQAIGGMIDALDGAVERSLPPDQVKDWQLARQQWRNYLALGKSVGANNDQTAVGNMSTAAFGRAAKGNPDLERLAQYGKAFVGDKTPNTSGTASHNMANHLLGGGLVAGGLEAYHNGLLTPHIAIPAAAAAALPYAFELGLNNPATRAALLARYRNPTPSFVTPSLLGQTTINALKGLR